VLLVSSKKDPCSWLVPGGGMEAGEEMATAAIREAWEEAGVQGHITKYLGLFETKHHSGSKKHRTAVFVVSVKNVLADYPEAYLGRGRQWFTLEDAFLHLARTRPMQSAYLQLLLVSRLKVSAS
ncbi:endopolyphosphatase activity protein, partial [Halocaridina rubra]